MESTGHTPETVAQAFLRAINRQDVDRLSELMSPTHRFTDSLGNVVEGRERMRAGWSAYFRMVPDYSIAIEEYYPSAAFLSPSFSEAIETDPVVIMLGIASGTWTRDGSMLPENRWQTPIAIRARIEDGLVAEWRVYADNDPLRRLMAGKE